jgi:dipeptidyl-peptidase-4
VTPPGDGVDEGNLSTAEKLRRKRLRERGLGVTRYEWAKGISSPRLMVPLPGGVCASWPQKVTLYELSEIVC